MSRLIALAAVCVALAGCELPAGSMDPAQALGPTPVIGHPAPAPGGAVPEPGPTSAPLPPIGASCSGGGVSQICLAVKYVSYIDPESRLPVVPEAGAIENVREINRLWGQCGVGFQIERYQAVTAATYGLNFSTASFDELDRIRAAFADNGELLIVTTGEWQRDGTLGQSPANAWTTLPGVGIHGVVLEAPVSSFAAIIAHELGHYLSLMHVSDELDLMNPIIYSSSISLTSDQCSSVRAAAAYFWPAMYR